MTNIISHKTIIDLVKKYPNDMELGKHVRQLVWQLNEQNPKNEKQLSIFDDYDEDVDTIAQRGID